MNDMTTCAKCGGSTSRNPNKVKPNQPDWLCDQKKGKCGAPGKKAGSWFPTGAWDKSYIANVNDAKIAEANGDYNEPTKEEWGIIGKQKMRTKLAEAYIRQGKAFAQVKEELIAWEEYVLGISDDPFNK